VLIGQEISLRFLVPRALALLEPNHLIEADFYPGDLLWTVLGIDKAYWQEHVQEWLDVNLIADEVTRACEHIRERLQAFKLDTFTENRG
jgi:CDI immunity proteins